MKRLSIFYSIILLLSFGIFLSCSSAKPKTTITKNPLLLFYNSPATDWMSQALPFGNGYVGAMFFGGINEEHIQFSEGSLWAGGPNSNPDYNFGIKKGSYKYLKTVRELLKQGKTKEADKIVRNKFTGILNSGKKYNSEFGDYGAQQTMGDFYVTIANAKGEVENYRRSLDISNSLSKVDYTIGNNKYSRTYFGDYPNNVMVYKFESSVKTDYIFKFKTQHVKVSEKFENKTYYFNGEVADNKMGFQTVFSFKLSDGTISYNKGEVIIKGAKDLIITHFSATDFKLKYPKYSGNKYIKINRENIKNIEDFDYNELKNEHLADYKNLFDRVTLNLGKNLYSEIPTDIRLVNYFDGNNDLFLESLYFQYARYLMISGSRPKTMSMHLQGKWNNSINPAWAADYHSNINLEMIYWPAELTNLSECQEPFLDYIESLVEPGTIAAKEFFNTRGWMVNTMCNAFGYTSPGWGIPWGFFPGGAGWFSQHLWDHYDFTQDKHYLKTEAYPVMKSAALFWIDYLTKNKDGDYVSSPSYSPEHGGISTGVSMDHQIAWDVLNNCIKAAKVLNIKSIFIEQAKQMRDEILKPQIGSWGQLQEWEKDIDDPNNKHRHISHLFALYPGNQISVLKTPELAEAAKISLDARGDGGTGWSKAWKINFRARLYDGDHAHKMLKLLLKPVISKKFEMAHGGGTYPNMLCAHPPFQLDGNMGGAAGMVEMLLQSHTGIIDILPALPSVWKNGDITGVKARGGYVINISWKNNKLSSLSIKSPKNIKINIRISGKIKQITLEKGENNISI